jgi:Zn-dependent peptidase ImmA (M78 family)
MMNRARIAAGRCLSDYFKSLGDENPVDDACRFISRLDADRISRCGLNDIQRGVIDDILARMRFDVDDLVENYLGITVWVDNLSEYDEKAGATVFGYAKPEANVIAICERVTYEPLRRVTILHELGHCLLHARSVMNSKYYSPRARKRPPGEKEADEFMIASVLPWEVLLLGLIRAADHMGMRIDELFGGANTRRGMYQWRTHHFQFLIDRLCVSREMVGIELLRRGIFSQATLNYHLSYRLRTIWSRPDQRKARGNLKDLLTRTM